jgi:tRNA uridine 5-carbamoylmethylation protein Kti12
VVHVPVELALERNAQREGPARVPDGIVRQMAARWEEPVVDEGFDSVEFVEQGPRTAAVEVM